MRWGVFSGVLWSLDTIVLRLTLPLLPFFGVPEASLASVLLHDAIYAATLFTYMVLRGRLKSTLAVARTRSGKAIALRALLNGPFGMTGYLIAINGIGLSSTTIISTFYPTVGIFLAYISFEEWAHLRQVLTLLAALGAIIPAEYPSTEVTGKGSPVVGTIMTFACVFDWDSEAIILAQGMEDNKVDEDSALRIRKTTSALAYLVVVGSIAGVISFTSAATPTPATGIIVLAALADTCPYLFCYEAINIVDVSRDMALNISYSARAVTFALLIMGMTPILLQAVCYLVILTDTIPTTTPNQKELHNGW